MYYLEDRGDTIRLYYLVRRDPPQSDEFRSKVARGRFVAGDAVGARLATGISMNATVEQVRRTARRFPTVWRYIAALDLPTDGRVRIERTTAVAGHFTVWATPEELRQYIAFIMPLWEERR